MGINEALKVQWRYTQHSWCNCKSMLSYTEVFITSCMLKKAKQNNANVIKRLRIHSFNEQNLIKTKIMWNQKKLILQCGCILMVINTINFVYFRNLSHCLISSAILFSSIVSRVVITVFHVYGSFFSCLQCSNTLVKSRIWLLYSASYASRMGTSICNCIPTWNHLTGLFCATTHS